MQKLDRPEKQADWTTKTRALSGDSEFDRRTLDYLSREDSECAAVDDF